MNIELYYIELMKVSSSVIILSGFIALTYNLILMLVNTLINAFTGKGLKW